MSEETGGPAFPAGKRFEGVDGWRTEPGMTLLDYAAIKAMQALLSDPDWRQDMDFADTADAAYRQAVEMIAAKARYA
jgi:hypothetical protein